MREVIDKFLNGYVEATREPFGNNAFGRFVRIDIPKAISSTGLVDDNRYLISAGVGVGNWAMVPWIGIFDKDITLSATKGVYIVYLLSKDGKRLYLTFNQGCTDIHKEHSKKETIAIMHEKAVKIREAIDSRGFTANDDIDLGENLSELGLFYQKGTIFYKAYMQGQVPAEEELQDDLSRMIEIYQDYVTLRETIEAPPEEGPDEGGNPEEDNEPPVEVEQKMSTKEIIEKIKQYTAQKGFLCRDDLIENLYLSLKAKPFVILAGVSGTGKSWITRLFAEAIGAGQNYEMISVRPDWSDASELLGYVNLDGRFIPGMLTSVLMKAAQAENQNKSFFICLDEMNLARVEYYFSDFLSVIETRGWNGDRIESRKIFKENSFGPDPDGVYRKQYGSLVIPDNVYIIGTVNMDETTHPFSKKVLDRANTIELSEIDLRADLAVKPEITGRAAAEPLSLDNQFLRSKYLDFQSCYQAHPDEMTQMVDILERINQALQPINAQIAYRVRNEIAYYLSYAVEDQLLTFEQAMDNALMQKILPRIQGEGHRIQRAFGGILDAIIPGENFSKEEDLLKALEKYQQNKSQYPYSKSIQKICFMLEGIRNNGYATYWL